MVINLQRSVTAGLVTQTCGVIAIGAAIVIAGEKTAPQARRRRAPKGVLFPPLERYARAKSRRPALLSADRCLHRDVGALRLPDEHVRGDLAPKLRSRGIPACRRGSRALAASPHHRRCMQ